MADSNWGLVKFWIIVQIIVVFSLVVGMVIWGYYIYQNIFPNPPDIVGAFLEGEGKSLVMEGFRPEDFRRINEHIKKEIKPLAGTRTFLSENKEKREVVIVKWPEIILSWETAAGEMSVIRLEKITGTGDSHGEKLIKKYGERRP